MQAQEIEHYLAELGAALQDQGINKPVRLLLIGGCNGYIAHPFVKKALWAVIANLFLSVRRDSAIDPGGELFLFTRENIGVWAEDHYRRHAKAA
ncbi:MAG TPA: hypothetical protein VKB35_19990 [Ktedonobacteraceae bacterium]|nr:hypothetical protein [Ktedonobacteraceae bacterium]